MLVDSLAIAAQSVTETPLLLKVFFALVLLGGLATNATLLYALLRRLVRREPLPPLRVVAPRWMLWDALYVYVGIFGAAIGVSFLLKMAAGDAVPDKESTRRLVHLAGTFTLPVAGALLIALILRLRKAPLRDLFGAADKRGPHPLLAGVLGFVAVMPLVVTTQKLCSFVFQKLHLPVEQQEFVKMLASEPNAWIVAALIILGIIIAPVFEEVLFRGLLYPAVKKQFGVPFAALAVSAMFAAQHANLVAALPLFLLGLGLVFAYELTGSLWTSVVMHSAFNSFSTLVIVHLRLATAASI